MQRTLVMVGGIIAIVGSCFYMIGSLSNYEYYETRNLGYGLFLLGLALAILGMSVKSGEAPTAIQAQPQPQVVGQFCPTCGSALAWIPEQQRSYCYQCGKYV